MLIFLVLHLLNHGAEVDGADMGEVDGAVGAVSEDLWMKTQKLHQKI